MENEETVIDLNNPPENGVVQYVSPNGTQVVHTDKGALLTNGDGSMIMCTPDGNSSCVLPNVLRVQLESIAEVEAHEIDRIGNRTEHVLTFRGGGLLECTVIKGKRTMEVVMRNLGFEFDRKQAHLHVDTTLHTAPLRLEHTMRVSCISEVAAHNILKIVGTTTHLLQCYQGYVTEYAYNERGEFINLARSEARRPPLDRDGSPSGF